MSIELDDETLQRFHDGDLSPVEEGVVRTKIAQDPQAQKRLKELERLGALIQLYADDAGSQLDSAAMFAHIDQQIRAQEKLGGGAQLRVIASDWVSEHKRVILPMVAVAAAAAFTVITLSPRDAGDENARTRHAQERVRYAEATPPAAQVHGTKVENVDFGRSTGTVFEIDTAGVATAVVWIADDEGELGGSAPEPFKEEP